MFLKWFSLIYQGKFCYNRKLVHTENLAPASLYKKLAIEIPNITVSIIQ